MNDDWSYIKSLDENALIHHERNYKMALIDHVSGHTKGVPHRRRNFGLLSYLALWRSRRALARLDARALEDIGIDSEAAQREARRHLWDVPSTWVNR
ncbi:DUF1127 domain-containing protein [uncultured Roseobacter sp.]|uniref:DUF1127 domain-containing protein n=2 Tax=Roseobacter TaxID=2433 RepID=UPI002603788A|nr:DUF1127 domain-containing protein [uncultured Roseobacter sp.]